MSGTTDVIAELVRAANQVGKLTKLERNTLFARAVTTIREMRQSVGIPSAQTDTDKIVNLQVMVAQIGATAERPEEIREALLTAAGMIRDLHIVLDTATEVLLSPNTREDPSNDADARGPDP